MLRVNKEKTILKRIMMAVLMIGVFFTGMNRATAQGVTVGKGGVGESGASSFVHHKATGRTDINVKVQNDKTSLCPNTGAIAVVAVNGEPVKFGNLTKSESSIAVAVKPGDNVIVVVHTIPLFNEIACIRLGELDFSLEQRDLESDAPAVH